MRGKPAADVGLAAGGGLLVFAADYPLQLPWLQLVAFVPLLVVCLRAPSWRRAALAGTAFALGWFAPLGIVLEGLGAPVPAATALALYLAAGLGVFAVVVFAARRWPVPVLGLTAGSCFAALEAVDAMLPMWGTCRMLARSWAVEPDVVAGLLRVGGPGTVGFVVVTVQAVVVAAVLRVRWRALLWAVPLLVAVPIANAFGETTPAHRLRVGVVGWDAPGGEADAERLVADAVGQGARLVVLPEGAFKVEPGTREEFDARWSAVARQHAVHLVVGFIDRDDPGNRLTVFGPDGAQIGRYTKTHLVPGEPHPPGDGALLVFDVDGVPVGAMICQDDNYRDMTAAYVAAGVGLVVVPTFEGPPPIAPYHYRNARLRTIEYPVTLARAAVHGTTAIVGPGGRVIAETDHPTAGARGLVADAPVP